MNEVAASIERDAPPTTWVRDEEVRALLTVDEAIAILAEAFALIPTQQAQIMPRSHLEWERGLLHVVGAAIPGAGISGVKTWTWTPKGARPVVVVFSTEDGSLRGVVEATALGQLRTAAASGLGTQLLAREDASVMAIIGTGRQALSQVKAVVAVRPIREVKVFGRDPGRRAAFARSVDRELELTVTEHPSAAEAVRCADVVTTVTRSRTPVLPGVLLEPGMHINAVGAIVSSSRELDADAVQRCSLIAVESRSQAEADAGDLLDAADRGMIRWDDVRELGELITGVGVRRRTQDISLLRTLGVGLEDVAVAGAVLERVSVARRL
jgi:alanine dehydrogenase